jgi:hypothetical protein
MDNCVYDKRVSCFCTSLAIICCIIIFYACFDAKFPVEIFIVACIGSLLAFCWECYSSLIIARFRNENMYVNRAGYEILRT